MFGKILLVILIAIVSIGILSVILTVIKLGIYKAFDFAVEKRLWLEYCIYFVALVLIISGVSWITKSFDTIPLARNILIVTGVGTIFEFFYFYKKYFDFESKGKFTISLVISNVAVIIFSDLLYYFVLVLILIILAVAM